VSIETVVDPARLVVPTEPGGAWTTVRSTLRSWPVVVGAGVLGVWVLVALTVPLWAWATPTESVGTRLTSPNWSHLLGTDALGRDVLLRTFYGARESIPTAAAVIVLTVIIGSTLGAIAGYVGGLVESVIRA
jgi:peptide/nickel transport system permease protein